MLWLGAAKLANRAKRKTLQRAPGAHVGVSRMACRVRGQQVGSVRPPRIAPTPRSESGLVDSAVQRQGEGGRDEAVDVRGGGVAQSNDVF